MFPVDTANFYQIFLHMKQIICPSEWQPYIKKQEKSIDTIGSIDTKFFRYLPSVLKINYLFVFRTVKRYNEMGEIVDKPREEHSHSVRLPNVTLLLCECVR